MQRNLQRAIGPYDGIGTRADWQLMTNGNDESNQPLSPPPIRRRSRLSEIVRAGGRGARFGAIFAAVSVCVVTVIAMVLLRVFSAASGPAPEIAQWPSLTVRDFCDFAVGTALAATYGAVIGAMMFAARAILFDHRRR